MLQTIKRRWPYIVLEHGSFKALCLRAPFMPESAVESNECTVNLFTHPWFNDCAFRSDIGKVNSLCTSHKWRARHSKKNIIAHIEEHEVPRIGFQFSHVYSEEFWFYSVMYTHLFTWGKLIFYDIMLYDWFVTFFSGLTYLFKLFLFISFDIMKPKKKKKKKPTQNSFSKAS